MMKRKVSFMKILRRIFREHITGINDLEVKEKLSTKFNFILDKLREGNFMMNTIL